MNSIFGFFFLFCVLTTGLIINPSSLLLSSDNSVLSFNLRYIAFAEEPQVNATSNDDTNSTSIDLNETMNVGDNMIGPDDTNSTTVTLNDTMNVGDNTVKPQDVLSPLKQIKEGTVPENVVCKEGLGLVFKLNGQPACVKTTSIEKLIAWGWAQ